MAITAESWDNAEVTYCYETSTRLGQQSTKRLPWAFVRLPGDEREFVVPSNALGLTLRGESPAVERAQHMPNAPFPLDGPGGASSQAGDNPGSRAVHFFGYGPG